MRFLPYEFMPVESVQLKCQFLVKTSQHLNCFGKLRIGKPEHLRMRGRNVLTREKNAVPPHPALERRTKRGYKVCARALSGRHFNNNNNNNNNNINSLTAVSKGRGPGISRKYIK